jgi:hypothetical protein
MSKAKQMITKMRAWYKAVGRVHCPILNEDVVFNSKGFYHLRYDNFGKRRSFSEQCYKIGLLPLSIPVIKGATKIYDYKKEQYSKPLGKFYEIWELKEVVGRQKTTVSVVLRRIGDGDITFLSIWKKRDNHSKNKKIVLKKTTKKPS